MLIGRTTITDTGIRIFDVDGSSIDLTAEDALDLATWIRNMPHYMALLDILRRKQVREKLAQQDLRDQADAMLSQRKKADSDTPAHPDAQSYLESEDR